MKERSYQFIQLSTFYEKNLTALKLSILGFFILMMNLSMNTDIFSNEHFIGEEKIFKDMVVTPQIKPMSELIRVFSSVVRFVKNFV